MRHFETLEEARAFAQSTDDPEVRIYKADYTAFSPIESKDFTDGIHFVVPDKQDIEDCEADTDTYELIRCQWGYDSVTGEDHLFITE
jgi:hypothetical protein